jgi:uncharacterized RDD family membrane protein YckC
MRLGAFLVDFFLMLIVFQVFMIPYLSAMTEQEIISKGIQLVAWFLLIGTVYKLFVTYLVAKFGGTPGHLLVGLQIVSEEGHKKLSFKRALFREYIGNVVASLFFALGYLWILKDSKRQGWHDMVSKTYVMAGEKETVRLALGFIVLGLVINFFIARDNMTRFINQMPVYMRMGESMKEEFDKPPAVPTPAFKREIFYDKDPGRMY